jgi:hypothetical protein
MFFTPHHVLCCFTDVIRGHCVVLGRYCIKAISGHAGWVSLSNSDTPVKCHKYKHSLYFYFYFFVFVLFSCLVLRSCLQVLIVFMQSYENRETPSSIWCWKGRNALFWEVRPVIEYDLKHSPLLFNLCSPWNKTYEFSCVSWLPLGCFLFSICVRTKSTFLCYVWELTANCNCETRIYFLPSSALHNTFHPSNTHRLVSLCQATVSHHRQKALTLWSRSSSK